MLKDCVILDGAIINVGAWDYQIQQVEVGENDPPTYEDVITNPLPEGATVEQRDFEHDHDRGWHEAGTIVLDPDAELTKAILAATTLEELKKALTGNGKLAKVKGQMK